MIVFPISHELLRNSCLRHVTCSDLLYFPVCLFFRHLHTGKRSKVNIKTHWRQGLISDRDMTSNQLFTWKMAVYFFGNLLEGRPLTSGNTAGHSKQLQNTSKGNTLIGGLSMNYKK